MLPARSILYATHSLLARNRAHQESNNPPDPDLARHFHIIPPASWKSSTAFVHWSNASRWISWFKSLIRFTKSVTEGNQVYQPSPARLPQTKASAFSFWKKMVQIRYVGGASPVVTPLPGPQSLDCWHWGKNKFINDLHHWAHASMKK